MNILFAFGDDWGKYASAYGDIPINKLLSTTHFDRIASEGVLFNNAFIPAPTCTPCRSSVLSGKYFWQTGLGAILFGAIWDDTIPTYPLELEKSGWHIGYTYKVWLPGEPANAPYGGERTAYKQAGTLFNDFSHVVTKRAPEIGIENAKNELYQEVRSNFKSFLSARPEGKPFCYWWGPTNTHRTWEQGSGKKLWNIDPDDLTGIMPDFIPDEHEVREDFADYLGECMAFDGGLGVLIECLEEIGELDNTLIVVSGDHGIPGMPRAKCNLYDIGCEVALAMRLPGYIQPGRKVDDMINLMDLAPTFLDFAGVAIPESMTAKSLVPLMTSDRSGQIENERNFVVVGRERHVPRARPGKLPYPQRAIRTTDFLYIINFEPDRWPIGVPPDEANMPSYYDLQWKTVIAYPDFDAGPTKAWMVYHKDEEPVKPLFDLAFGKRPFEELYDLKKDPCHMHNVAADAEYANIKSELNEKLMNLLVMQNDPRVTETPCRYEHLPYTV